jgi:hypothetical protein
MPLGSGEAELLSQGSGKATLASLGSGEAEPDLWWSGGVARALRLGLVLCRPWPYDSLVRLSRIFRES